MLTNIATYVPAYLSTYLPTNLPTYLSIYLPTKNLTYCPNSLHSWPRFSMCSNALTNINIYLPFYLHVKRLPNTPQILKINCSVYEYMNLLKKNVHLHKVIVEKHHSLLFLCLWEFVYKEK